MNKSAVTEQIVKEQYEKIMFNRLPFLQIFSQILR